MGNINFSCPYGGKYVNLRNELVFSEFKMSLVEMRLLYYVMSSFDISDVIGENGKVINDNDVYKMYKTSSIESRSLLISQSDLILNVNVRSKNLKPIEKAIKHLNKKIIRLNSSDGESKDIVAVEFAEIFKHPEYKLKYLLITFSEEFMQYIYGIKGFHRIEIPLVMTFKSTLALRYYHWLLYAKGNNRKVLPVSIETLKKRLCVNDEHNPHFFQRNVKKPMEEAAVKAGVKISIEKFKNRQVRGYPLQSIRVHILN